jgi:hypothetical protein
VTGNLGLCRPSYLERLGAAGYSEGTRSSSSGERGGTGGGLVLTVKHVTGGGVGGGGFLRGDLRFRHSRGGLDLKGGVE